MELPLSGPTKLERTGPTSTLQLSRIIKIIKQTVCLDHCVHHCIIFIEDDPVLLSWLLHNVELDSSFEIFANKICLDTQKVELSEHEHSAHNY